jgi:hypothetical protein
MNQNFEVLPEASSALQADIDRKPEHIQKESGR